MEKERKQRLKQRGKIAWKADDWSSCKTRGMESNLFVIAGMSRTLWKSQRVIFNKPVYRNIAKHKFLTGIYDNVQMIDKFLQRGWV